jgi:hypothetical protein
LYGRSVIEERETAVLQKKWQEETEEARRKANSPEGKRHEEFRNAIFFNDSVKVIQMAEQGEKATDEDLSDAIYQCFEVNNKISPDIFKTLITHGADARKAPPAFSYNRLCKNFETVKLLLDAGASPLPEKDYYPLVCLPQLKLLLQYGGINFLSRVYYESYKQETEGVRSSISQAGHWTPIMYYLWAYPKYFEEAKFLLTQKPDLKYKDEHGYTLQILLNDIIYKQKSMGEPVEALIEFGKRIQ